MRRTTALPPDGMRDEHLPSLDGWRGMAIGMLLLGHFCSIPGISFGAVGVDLFFVLSGLLMARLLFVQETPLPIFYRRRISRIFPACFVFLAVTTLAYAALGLPIRWSELGPAVLFVNNYFQGGPTDNVMPVGHMWSLAVEEHSYVVLSLMAVAARRRGWSALVATGLAAAFCVGMGVCYWTEDSGRTLEFGRWLHTEVSAYGIVVSAFLLLLLRRTGVPKLPALTLPLLLVAGICLHWWSVASPLRTTLGVGLFALAVNLLPSAPRMVQAVLSFKPLRLLGLWSFSIYLWQQPFYLLVHRAGWWWPIGLGCGVVAGIVSFYAIEQPARAYLNRVWGRRAAPSPTGSAYFSNFK